MQRRAFILVFLLVLGACTSSTEDTFGVDLYQQACQRCHAVDGSGGLGTAIGADSPAVGLSDEQLGNVIRVGPGTMPSYPQLTDEQVASLVDVIRDLQAGDG